MDKYELMRRVQDELKLPAIHMNLDSRDFTEEEFEKILTYIKLYILPAIEE